MSDERARLEPLPPDASSVLAIAAGMMFMAAELLEQPDGIRRRESAAMLRVVSLQLAELAGVALGDDFAAALAAGRSPQGTPQR